ncbi:hypothetical protein [Streptomyces sp. NPDC096153]|uniref:hypothetical protein n=1 Tax=Streptomyces sp. NPDC096153 TaxID=3155548 RepID=UPI003318E422
MAVGTAHILYCDRPGCRSHITLIDTRNAAHARTVASQQYGWTTGARDLCPNEHSEERRA